MTEENDPLSLERLAFEAKIRGLASKTYTFLSIDVINSTQLKSEENDEDIIFTFLAYQCFIERLAKLNNGEILSITGDGVMCRFPEPADALATGIAVIDALPEFNKKNNVLRRPVELRLGVNTGKMYIDKQTGQSGGIISQAIDLAGYLQKSAPPNSMLASQAVIDQAQKTFPALSTLRFDERYRFQTYCYSGAPVSASPQERQGPKKLKVLVADDEPDASYFFSRMFEGRGHETAIAFDGPGALRLTQAWKPDIILLDIGLPGIDGYQVLRQLRSNKLDYQGPIIMLGRRCSVEDIDLSQTWGANCCIKKPCDERRLIIKVEELAKGLIHTRSI
ncbi:MAG: response regulator [Elusimicrobiota bacterium]